MKEVDLYKSRLAQAEASENKRDFIERNSLETDLLERFKKYVKEFEGKGKEVVNILADSISHYGPYGDEKIKILDKSFEGFLENVLSGSNMKLAFYVAERNMPTKLKEYESYAKKKKYQRYEEFPDEFVREYLNARVSSPTIKEEFNHYNKNKNPIILKIKKRLKAGLQKLFDARDEIYKSLMQCDMLINLTPGFCCVKAALLSKIEELKYSNFMISYKQALDIEEEEGEIEEKIKVPNPKAYENLLKHNNEQKLLSLVKKEYTKTFKYKKLLFTS